MVLLAEITTCPSLGGIARATGHDVHTSTIDEEFFELVEHPAKHLTRHPPH